MKALRTFLSIVLVCALSATLWYFLITFIPSTGAMAVGAKNIDFLEVMVWIALPVAVGIFLGKVFFTLASMSEERVNVWEILRDMPMRRDVWLAVFASPLIVMGLYLLFNDRIDSAQTIVTAFQNGFFIESALAAVVGGRPPNVEQPSSG